MQKAFAFGASRDDMPRSINGMPTQFSDVLTKVHSKKLSLPAFSHVSGCSAGCPPRTVCELGSAPPSPAGTAHYQIILQLLFRLSFASGPEDARTAPGHLSGTEVSALCLQKRTAQPERRKSVCWNSCSIGKQENLRIADRNKEQRR